MLTVKDAIQNTTLPTPFTIEYRFVMQPDYEDELFGFAEWDGTQLNSLDGDSYDLDDEIISFQEVETKSGKKMLSVIFLADTLTDRDLDEYRTQVLGLSPIVESEFETELLEEAEEISTSKDRNRAQRRKQDIRKALRKQNICKTHYGWEYYQNLHQYSKNKIHCSCPLCSAKTNVKKWKGNGPVSNRGHFGQTNERYGNRNYKASDKKKMESIMEKEREYSSGEMDVTYGECE